MLEQLMLKIRNVPQNPETVFDPFAQEMAKLLGEDLETIACYGSAASGDYVYGRSDINMVLLFKTVSVPHLKVISIPMEKWATRGFAAPLILTRKDLDRALDALPLLFMELRDNHRVIHGPDPFQALTIEKAHLRLQVEQMLRNKLTEARTEFIASGESLSTFENMLAKSFNSLIPLLRGMLVLTGATPSVRKDLVVASAEERFRLEPGLLTDCLRHKMGLLRISDKHNLLKFYEKYLGTIEHLADLADGLAT